MVGIPAGVEQSQVEVTIPVPSGPEQVTVLGAAERNLKMIREALGVSVTARQAEVALHSDRRSVSVAATAGAAGDGGSGSRGSQPAAECWT